MNLTKETLTDSQLSDEELASEAQAGSRQCFEKLVHRYTQRLFYYIRPKMATDQDTEDIIQDTFIKIYRNIERYNKQYKFSTWLYTVAVRLVISFHRKKRLRDTFFSKEPSHDTDEQKDPQEHLIREEEIDSLWDFARRLPPHQYQVLWLRYVEQQSLKEIGNIMKKTQVHIRVLLHRARVNLSKQMNRETVPHNSKKPAAAGFKYTFFL